MDVVKIDDVSREKARELYAQYKAHRHYATPVDDAIRKAYREIAKGGVVIKALESVASAGLNDQRLPKLAIGRADMPDVHLRIEHNGAAVFAGSQDAFHRRAAGGKRFAFPAGTFPGAANDKWQYRAITPMIPAYLRPRHALDNYHILWEADWHAIPRDPYLLRRIGDADLWLVLAAWDLTEVERAAMASRVSLQ